MQWFRNPRVVRIVALLVAASAAAVAPVSYAESIYKPDARFNAGATFRVEVVDYNASVDQRCVALGTYRSERYRIRACTLRLMNRAYRVVMNNPCRPEYAGEQFAEEFCHELGHVNGFRHPEYR